jgi:hypothetical protein
VFPCQRLPTAAGDKDPAAFPRAIRFAVPNQQQLWPTSRRLGRNDST